MITRQALGLLADRTANQAMEIMLPARVIVDMVQECTNDAVEASADDDAAAAVYDHVECVVEVSDRLGGLDSSGIDKGRLRQLW